MAVDPKRASLIGARELPRVVEAAIHAAGLQTGTAGALVVRWDLAGRVVRDFNEGQKFSEAVAKHVSAGGIDATPAVLAIDKKIIAGFFERIAVPQIRNLQRVAQEMRDDQIPLSCPSAQPGMGDAGVFGVIGGTIGQPRVAYLKQRAEITPEMLDSVGELDPTLVFRFAGRCENERCGQFSDGRCGLGQRILEQLPAVVSMPPPCQVRPTCRWHRERGDEICLRCPQVMTRVPPDNHRLRAAARADT